MTALSILFHDGCNICLDVAATFTKVMEVLEVVDLGQHPERADEARRLGVDALPAIVIDGKVFPLNPHSTLAEH